MVQSYGDSAPLSREDGREFARASGQALVANMQAQAALMPVADLQRQDGKRIGDATG